MIRSRRTALICIAIAVLAVVGYAQWRWPNAVAQALLGPPGNPATIVVSGNIEAHESVLSFTQVQAPIIELALDEGATVAKDTVLARVDDSLYRRQTEIDRANLGVASAQVAVYASTLAAAQSNVSSDGFDLVEKQRDYARAEDESRAAAELEPHSFWPHHTVSHVMEMTGRPQDGLGWMSAREEYWASPDNVTRVHIWWHKSLFHLELGQYDAALALYDGPILETLRPLGLNLCNPTALLWRLDLLGCDVAERWRDLVALRQAQALPRAEQPTLG